MLLRAYEEPMAPAGWELLRGWRFASFLEQYAWRYRSYVWILIGAFYLLSFNGVWRPGPDSALYLSVARSIARGEGYAYLGEAHRLAYPGLPYLLAGTMRLAGDYAVTIAIGIIWLMSLGALALSYRLFRLMARPGAAVVATVFTAVNFGIYELAFEVLTDIPFLLGTMMVLLGAALSGVAPAPRLSDEAHEPSPHERRLGWALLPAGLLLCAAMRPTFYLLAGCVLAAGLIQAIRTKRVSRGAIAVAGLLALVLGMMALSDPRRSAETQDVYEQAVSIQLQHAASNLLVPLSNAWSIVTPELPTAYFGYSWSPYLNPVMVAVLLGATGWVLWRWPLAMLWIGVTLAVQLIVEPVPRYFVPVIPLLALAWWEGATRVAARCSLRTGNVIAMAAYVVLVPSFFRCLGQVWFDQYRRPFVSQFRNGRYAAVSEMARMIKERVPQGAVVVAPEKTDRVLTYMADRWAVAVGEPIPERLRDLPVWMVFPKQDPGWRNEYMPIVSPATKEGETSTHYRDQGVLVLRQATWKK